MRTPRPVGEVTRGTTAPNRLRRVDRWLLATYGHLLRRADATVVDLGFGATPVTTAELAARVHAGHPDVEVVGLEIDPDRVAAAQPLTGPRLRFAHGGFELAGLRDVAVIRAFNVLRQYDEDAVGPAWERLVSSLAPEGVLVDGTCDELGRRASWVAVDATGPVSLTISVSLRALSRPSDVAERLPKALIHRNVPGERVYDWLTAMDRAWARAAPIGSYGARQRWLATVADVRQSGWPVTGSPARWRQGEVTVAWDAVAPGIRPDVDRQARE